MPDFSIRSADKELMDGLDHPAEIINPTLKEVENINRLLGGFDVTLDGLAQLLKMMQGKVQHAGSLAISDWGCGSGDLLRQIDTWLVKRSIAGVLEGLDIDPATVEYARSRTQARNIAFFKRDVLEGVVENGTMDVVISCLFTHHFADEAWKKLVVNMVKVSRIGVIVNDLHRHWFAYYAIKYLTRIFSRSRLVRNDAPLSVLRGFKKSELHRLLVEAGISNYKIKWMWAFRWQIIILK